MRPLYIVIAAISLAGCSSHPDPIVDTRGVNMTVYEEDLADCEGYSDQVHIENGMVRGAAVGAATGGAIGAIRDRDIGEDAAVGAVWGASRSGVQGAKEKEGVVKRCLRYRGYRVLN